MEVAVTGSHGLVGSALVRALVREGHRARRIVRGTPAGRDEIGWDPETGSVDAAGLDGVDAVVHLAGAGIGDKRWTPERKRLILESRTRGTDVLARTLAGMARKPAVLLSASGIDYYGPHGDEELTEESPPGTGFLAGVCERWEDATDPAADAGIRIAHIRTGPVLSADGGLLARLLLPFRMGLGGRVGSGSQYMSWIALDDHISAILHLLARDDTSGAYNLTAPIPVTNREFTETLGRVVHRPTRIPTPLLPLKLRYGSELVDELLLTGQRVFPRRLEEAGYRFARPTLEEALRAAVDRH
ncbi:MAG TPA: TIGR01777 family oxidoreductase [Acidimicrobiia bacterium]|nr:TIGR01777 family oxidoreductase [Acidimicrobiia bacterium]